MSSKIVFNPPKPVAGHPIEIVELHHGQDSYIWLIKLRLSTSDPPVEWELRYDAGKRITIDLPFDAQARQALLDVRGPSPSRGNPLSEAIESALDQP